jgi:hypothetical protein
VGRTTAAAPPPDGNRAAAPPPGDGRSAAATGHGRSAAATGDGRAVAATGGTANGSPPARRHRRGRTVALLSSAGAAILIVVVLAVVLPVLAPRPSSPPAQPTCPTVRRYTVEERGRLLDAAGHLVGEIVPGDVVDAEHLDTGPYRSRRRVTVVSTGKEGYVDPAKLHFVATICRTSH